MFSSKIKCVFFDVDGTLTDIRRRYYESFRRPLEREGISYPNFKKLFELKRKPLSGLKIFKKITKDNKTARKCEEYRIRLLKSEELIKSDYLFSGVKRLLKKIKESGIRVVLITYRQNPESLRNQMGHLGISKFINDYFAREAGEELNPIEYKVRIILKVLKNKKISPQAALMIGDTEVDIRAGKRANLVTVAVSSGLRKRTYLEKESPDYLFTKVTQLNKLL